MMGTGKRNHYQEVLARFQKNGVDLGNMPHVKICEYIYDMDVVMAAADLVVSRAGASTLCELTALGKPSILVPSPYVTGNHQEHNARAVERGGGAKVILEKDFNPESLKNTVAEITDHPETILSMQEDAKKMGRMDALETLYLELKKMMKK